MSRRCLGCMELFGDEYEICPHCGYIVGTDAEEAIHMEPGTLLHDRYIVGKVLGYGGFGVTYLGWDGKLEQKVAIKEYLPGEFSTRMPGQSQVTVFGGEKSEQFHDGLKKFVEEAKHLAKFQNEPGIVKIFDSFEENETAYIIMEYLDGETLTSYLKREKTIPEDKAVEMMMPVMESLRTVHAEGLLHRDIAPDNIFLLKSGEVKLIDFGASRYATTSHSRSLTVIIKPGYSPEEQYRSRGDQGAYTDVYAIAATLYKMITGKTPPDAMERRAKYENQNKDILEEPHKIEKNISVGREIAILNAMNVRIEDRTPDVETLIKELNADPPAKRIYGKIKKIDLYSWPLWLKIAIPTALACVAVFVCLLLTGVINFSLFSEEIVIPDGIVVVPDVEGEYNDEALNIVEAGRLLATTGGTIESQYIPAGKIILQNPVGGSYMKINGMVVLTVSSGKGVEEAKDGISTVPYIIWDNKEEAISKLRQAGLGEPKVEEEYNNNVAYGQVISQSVQAGEKVDEGTVITIRVSLGAASFEMPNVTGKLFTDAQEELSGRGLSVSIEYKKDDKVPENNVISQSIEAGSEVKRGDKVVLTVSSGKNTVEVADVRGKSEKEAVDTLKKQGFKVTVLENYDNEVQKGNVIDQSPEAGTTQIEGSTVTVYVSKGKQPVEVKLDANGGTLKENKVTVYLASAYGELQTPVKSGETFIGWYTEKEGGAKITDSTVVTSSAEHTLYARYSTNSYTVKFDACGGSVSQTESTVAYGSEYGTLPTPTNTGSMFLGWYTEKDGGSRVLSNTKVNAASDHTLYAHWEIIKYTVSFNEQTTPASLDVVYGSAYGTLPVLEKTGYTFLGWYTEKDGGTQVTDSTAVGIADNHMLYAHWEAHKYTVSFNEQVTPASISVTYGVLYGALPTPSKTGYTFLGWFTSQDGGIEITGNSLVNIESDITLYARWNANKYTVSFDEPVTPSSVSVTYGMPYGTLPAPTKTGYTFSGWYTAKDGGVQITESTTVNLESDIVLYARWTAKSIRVTFDANGGLLSSTATGIQAKKYDQNSGLILLGKEGLSTLDETVEIVVTYGMPYGTLPVPTKTGYTFSGWYTAKDGGTEVTENTTVTVEVDHTLYAHWKACNYKLYFDANGGSLSTSETSIAYGETYGDLPTPTRDYYKFTGWYTAKDGGSQVSSATSMGAGDVTVYAHWEEKTLSDWVLASNVPSGAQIIERKWTYTKTETKESESSSMSGWSPDGSYWQQTGSGTYYYASFPSGFNTGDSLYSKFNKSALSASDNGSTKREVSGGSFNSYIYWHWTYAIANASNERGNTYDRPISDTRGTRLSYGAATAWYAFESTTNYSKYDSRSYKATGPFSPYSNSSYPSSYYWFRFETYKQTYTDYKKIYKYKKVSNLESSTEVSSGGQISNVNAYVRYREK